MDIENRHLYPTNMRNSRQNTTKYTIKAHSTVRISCASHSETVFLLSYRKITMKLHYKYVKSVSNIE